MGELIYNSTTKFAFDERLLAHLQVVIRTKLSRNESFEFSWVTDPTAGNGRDTIWLSPAILLEFRYSSNKTISLNPAWIASLMETAQAAGGLRVVPEPAEG